MPFKGLQGVGHIPYERDEYWEECCEYLGYECLTKSDIYSQLGYVQLPTIELLHRSRATHRILVGGNRSGKSYGAAYEALPYLFWIGTRGWIVSENYDLASEIYRKIEDALLEQAGMEKVLRTDNLQSWQFAFSAREYKLTMGTGSTLQLKSTRQPESMHAVPLDYVIIDEAALLPYILYDTRLIPRLVDSGGWAMSLGTLEPLQGEWFEEYFDIGQTENELSIESWEHPTEDNYHVYVAKGGETPEQVGAAYRVNWRKLTDMNPEMEWPLRPGQQVIIWNIDLGWLAKEKNRITPEIFAARYEAKKAASPYTVFPEWSIVTHVDKDAADFDEELPVYLAIDPGSTYAVAAVQFKRFDEDNDNELTNGLTMCIIDELYFQNTVTTQIVYNAATYRDWWPNVARWHRDWWDPVQGAIDVMAAEQALTWSALAREDDDMQRLFLKRRKVNVQPGIQTLQHYISTGTVIAHPRCTFWNLEMNRYQYTPPSFAKVDIEDPRKARNPKDAWNHLVKAVTYLAVNKYGYYGKSGKSATSSRRDARKRRKEDRQGLMRAVVSRFRR